MSIPLGPRPAANKVPSRGFWPLRDLPTAIWLMLAVAAALLHRQLPAPRWLLIHLLMLGALSHAILVWSQYFATALLKLAVNEKSRRGQTIRLSLMNFGALVVVTGVLSDIWLVTLSGATSIAVAALWHGVWLMWQIKGAFLSPFSPSVRYYIAAAGLLPVGAGLGTWLSTGLPSPLHERIMLAHALTNVLGWVGLTVAGTLITLWPTMLRTRIAPDAALQLRRALPVLLAGVIIAVASASAGLRLPTALGLLIYIGGLGYMASPFLYAARSKPPRTFSTLSVLTAVAWWVGTLLWALYGLLQNSDWVGVGSIFDKLVPFLVAGFGVQILIGALSYLIPVALGGGPRAVRAATAAFDRGALWRVSMANSALVVCALPVSSLVRVFSSVLYLVAVASFIPVLFGALKSQRIAKNEAVHNPAVLPKARRSPVAPEGERPAGQRMGQAAAGIMAVVLAVSVGVSLDPAASGLRAPEDPVQYDAPAAAHNAPIKTVEVTAEDMRFTPSRIEVEAGTHLIIKLTNTDESQIHDLVLANGAGSGRLAPGENAEVDAGVIVTDVEGWCSIVGHRQMGMVLQIIVSSTNTSAQTEQNSPDPLGSSTSENHEAMPGMDHPKGSTTLNGNLDLSAEPSDGFSAFDPVLSPLPKEAGKQVIHRQKFTVSELETEVAAGYTQKLWTFNSTAPGPTLHGRVGDRFEITLYNDGSLGHSIDFHAGSLAPDEPMRTIAPGEELVYTFTATKSGMWMYHCSTKPMSAHIANGMFGAVVIEPEDLPEVDRSYLLVQSEFYLGPQGQPVDVDKVSTQNPDLVVFNGYANQYAFQPLQVKAKEKIRIWVLNAGPNRPSSFHVIGGQFDSVFFEGGYLLDARDKASGGSQALALAPAQGGFVELSLPEAGNYPFVTHYMSDAEKGAHGMIHVSE